MIIFLVGFMGCGKTTFGKRLANKLSYAFVDLDKVIEAEVGMSIPQYFAEFGEESFRIKESEILKNTRFSDNAVVATGGGAPCFFDNMDWMNNKGLTVYISLSAKGLARRLETASEERPVLRGLKGLQLEEFIASKLSERDPYYSKAALIVEGINISPESFMPIFEDYQRR
ncbi:shikimate kinase [Desertivirga xinjiangensis]|uniref:shikimate kinase n=1 Tax=Desertivirga xinjiangensis TaxID=539206 RepID=UPI00210C2FAC|nr:shikimate kinase [Pedobacter xinjiangensis]